MGVRTVKADSSSTLLQFNSGALDAMYSSPLFVGALWSQYRRVVTHMTPFKVSPFFGAILVNARSWNKIPEDLRPLLRESAERVCKEIGDQAVRLEDEAIESMRRSGLVVPPYSAADAAAWSALYADKIGGVVVDWYSPDFVKAIFAATGR